MTLPSGATYEHPELPEQDRKHGWEQVKELPGIEQPSDVGEIVENGEHLPGHGEHDLVIGDNPNGEGEILLQLIDAVIVSASQPITSYDGRDVSVERALEKIVNEKDDWDHNLLGSTKKEVRNTLQNLLNDPDEVYEATRESDGATITVFVKEMVIDGNEVIIFGLVRDGRLVTSFVPAGEAPSGSSYDQVYDRDAAIEYIMEEVLSKATGHSSIQKIEEFTEVISEIDEGDWV